MNRTWLLVVALLLVGWAEKKVAAAVDATYVLGIPSITGSTASYPIWLEYATDTGEEVVFFSVDVRNSSTLLTANRTDYDRFDFIPASPSLDGWDQLPGTGLGAGSSIVEYDTFTSPIAAGLHRLGTLQAEFVGTTLTPGVFGSVSLDADDSVIGVEVAGQVGSFRFVEVKHRVEMVPEPTAVHYGLILLASLLRFRAMRPR